MGSDAIAESSSFHMKNKIFLAARIPNFTSHLQQGFFNWNWGFQSTLLGIISSEKQIISKNPSKNKPRKVGDFFKVEKLRWKCFGDSNHPSILQVFIICCTLGFLRFPFIVSWRQTVSLPQNNMVILMPKWSKLGKMKLEIWSKTVLAASSYEPLGLESKTRSPPQMIRNSGTWASEIRHCCWNDATWDQPEDSQTADVNDRSSVKNVLARCTAPVCRSHDPCPASLQQTFGLESRASERILPSWSTWHDLQLRCSLSEEIDETWLWCSLSSST